MAFKRSPGCEGAPWLPKTWVILFSDASQEMRPDQTRAHPLFIHIKASVVHAMMDFDHYKVVLANNIVFEKTYFTILLDSFYLDFYIDGNFL